MKFYNFPKRGKNIEILIAAVRRKNDLKFAVTPSDIVLETYWAPKGTWWREKKWDEGKKIFVTAFAFSFKCLLFPEKLCVTPRNFAFTHKELKSFCEQMQSFMGEHNGFASKRNVCQERAQNHWLIIIQSPETVIIYKCRLLQQIYNRWVAN